MLENDTNCAVSWRARPGSFVSLMSLYESNYIRLAWLVPDLHGVEGSQVSHVAGDCPLHLAVDERARYTTTFRLTYVFDDAGTPLADPRRQAVPPPGRAGAVVSVPHHHD